MSRPVSDISPATGLKPKTMFIPEVGEQCVNMDGVIAVMQQTHTPEARRIYRAFRRRHAEFRLSMPDKAPEKVRTEALLAAVADCGIRVTMKPTGAGEA